MEAVLLLALWNFYSGTFIWCGTLIMYTRVGSKYSVLLGIHVYVVLCNKDGAIQKEHFISYSAARRLHHLYLHFENINLLKS